MVSGLNCLVSFLLLQGARKNHLSLSGVNSAGSDTAESAETAESDTAEFRSIALTWFCPELHLSFLLPDPQMSPTSIAIITETMQCTDCLFFFLKT